MKTRGANDSTIALVIVTIALIVSCFLLRGRFSVSDTPERREQQRRVLLLYQTDHEALLKAGREVLRQGPKDPMKFEYYGIIYLGGFPVPKGVRIPKIIRDLRTYDTRINFSGYLFLEMEGGVTGFGLRIYPERFTAPRRYFEYGNRELLPGLWYYDDRYNHIPGYDKTIDRVIQTGRWEEPNSLHSRNSN